MKTILSMSTGALLFSLSALLPLSAHGAQLEEVIVTAQRQSESLQDTPISLVTFGEDRLEKEGISSLADLKANVPGLTIEPFPLDNSNLRIYIRGIGLIDTQVTQDTPIGVYLDGIYIARSAGLSLDLAELKRIEVLRGPQGTLYGRNSTGGTVNLVTKRASTEELTIQQKLTAGNYGLLTAKTSVNLPINSRAAVKLAYLHTQFGGYIENTGLGKEFGERKADGVRLDFRYDINDAISLDYSYEKADSRYANLSYQPVRPQPLSGGTDANSILNDAIRREATPFMVYSEDRQSKMFTAVPLLESKNVVSGQKFDIRYESEGFEVQYLLGYRTLKNYTYADVSTGSLSADFRVDTNSYSTRDGAFGTPTVSTPEVIPSLIQDQISHELKFSGDLFEDSVAYIFGVYYFEEDAVNDQPYHHEFQGLVSNETTGGITSKSNLLQVGTQKFEIENSAIAAYGRLTYKTSLLSRDLELTVGARHSEDKRLARKFTSTQQFAETWTEDSSGNILTASTAPVDDFGYSATGENDFSDDSFDFIAEYKLTDSINIYAKTGEAYKSGGYNTRDPDPVFFARGFGEEKANTFEVGIKSELFDRRLRINGDVFLTEYTDLQVNFQINGAIDNTRVLNVGEAEVSGAELDINFAATRQLLLSLNYSYLDPTITSVTDPDTNEEVRDRFVFSSAPMHSYVLSADWVVLQGSWGELEATFSYNFMDSRKGGPLAEKVVNVSLEPFDLFNARLGLNGVRVGDAVFSAALWAKNVLNEEYTINAFDHLPQAGKAVIWGDPRTFGLDLTVNF